MNDLVDLIKKAREDAEGEAAIRKIVAKQGDEFHAEVSKFMEVIKSQDRVYRVPYAMTEVDQTKILYKNLGPSASIAKQAELIDTYFDLSYKLEKHLNGPTRILKVLEKLQSSHTRLIETHENPDLGVLDLIINSRIGSVASHRSKNPEAGRSFKLHFNSSVDATKEKYRAHMRKIERKIKRRASNSNGKMRFRVLKGHSLSLTL